MDFNYSNCRSAVALQHMAQQHATHITSLHYNRREDHCHGATMDRFIGGDHVSSSYETRPAWENTKCPPEFRGFHMVERPDGSGSAYIVDAGSYGSTVHEYVRWADGSIEAFAYSNKTGKLEVKELPEKTTNLVTSQQLNLKGWESIQRACQPRENLGLTCI